jgi:hypothetical protein
MAPSAFKGGGRQREQRRGAERDRKQAKVQDGASNIELELETLTRYLLDKLVKEFAVEPHVLVSELFKAGLNDAWAAAGNPFPDDDEITEHYGEEACKRFDEMG